LWGELEVICELTRRKEGRKREMLTRGIGVYDFVECGGKDNVHDGCYCVGWDDIVPFTLDASGWRNRRLFGDRYNVVILKFRDG
jgi:hypothetical protein